MTGPRFKKPRSMGPHYVNNKDFYRALAEHRENVLAYQRPGSNLPEPRASDYIGRCIMLICERLSLKPNFVGYSHRDEMVDDAVTNCSAAINNFNPEKSNNPFSYFTSIAYNAFLRRIQDEKNEKYAKCKNLLRMTSLGQENSYMEGDDDRAYRRTALEIDSYIADFERKVSRRKSRGKKPRGVERFQSAVKLGHARIGLNLKH